MLKLSSKITYALKALVDLALYQGTGSVTVATVAKRQGIPASSLEQLFYQLGQKGLVTAERGPRGGYRLSSPAGQIMVSQIFDALETHKKQPDPNSPTYALWQQVEQAVRKTLEATTLEHLAEQAGEGPAKVEHTYPFHI